MFYVTARGTALINLVKQNVLVDYAGHVRLSDIGFTPFVHDEESETDANGCSTHDPRWTASEVSRNGEYSKQSDVFSFGFVATEVRSRKHHLPMAMINNV